MSNTNQSRCMRPGKENSFLLRLEKLVAGQEGTLEMVQKRWRTGLEKGNRIASFLGVNRLVSAGPCADGASTAIVGLKARLEAAVVRDPRMVAMKSGDGVARCVNSFLVLIWSWLVVELKWRWDAS
ncbi:uncharacterized protein LAJ45_00384 [Morchella importuna]|uniref:uncharacterized protein n=1 Tax=Morchella importuna TaxID=1174673 RepID=UPI001E8D535A|nr:uncharacterized protein LAJ45_00384 [Morchella importuna]KAH8155374.1 hypothetical protein LAJ45_00384 [Morchella importuna]